MIIDKTVAMKSSQYIGFLIMDCFSKTKREKMSIFDVSDRITKHESINARQLIMGMFFLYTVGLIEFSEANIWLIK
jgi:hypothetical protein